MKKNYSENIISQINTNVFFKEFTFSKNDFTDISSKQKIEFSDNVVWIDDIFLIFEIKERKLDEIQGEIKWFNNKVLNKAVKQIKNTHKYLNKYPNIPIINEKGHIKNISEANLSDIQNIVIYHTNNEFNEEKRFIKFYNSSKIGLIHLFHSEDYYWICKYLLTPAEIKEYLIFREELYLKHSKEINKLPEQYVLGHFLETLDITEINLKYLDNLKKIKPDLYDFNMSFLIEQFNSIIQLIKGKTEYYPIIAEIAKLNRTELSEFKKRFIRTIEKCKESEIDMPYRIYVPRTDCGFVFIPLIKKASKHWKTALKNYTYAQKYIERASRCVGLVIFENEIENENFLDMYWMYLEENWKYDIKFEELLKENFPFREVKMRKIENRYIE